MNEELREAIGRALYEASFVDNSDMPTWDELSEDTWIRKSTWIARAEKVVEVYKDWIGRQAQKVVSWPGRVDVW